MYSSEIIERRKEKRREKQSKIRQALMINDYIYTKYFTIYEEAARYYNELNAIHPAKYDLRKCPEFKAWKAGVNGHSIRDKKHYIKAYHSDIPLDSPDKQPNASEIPFEQPVDILVQPIESPDQQPNASEIPFEQPVDILVQPIESPDQQPDASPIFQLNASEIPIEPLEIIVESTESPNEHPVPSPIQQPIEQPVPRPIHVPVKGRKSLQKMEKKPGKKVLELKIPLLKPTVVTKTLCTVTQETVQEGENPLQIATEEIMEESTMINPTLEDELPKEVIDRIINELREDAELKNIMEDIEQDFDFDQLANDIELPECDRLEEELGNMVLR